MGAPWLAANIAAITSSLGALGLLVDVQHLAWIGADDSGKPTHAAGVPYQAQVQLGTKQTRDVGGEVITPRACLSIFSPIAPNGAAGRVSEPIDGRDLFSFTVDGVAFVGSPIVDNDGSQALAGAVAGEGRPVHVVWLR